MGCDIHGWVEKRVNDKWIAVSELEDTSRNYERFSRLAGVRGMGPAPKGIPDDVSETTKYHIDEYGEDGHSHSWLPVSEVWEIFKATNFRNDHYTYWSVFGNYIDWEHEQQLYRLVFWFDN